MIPKKIHYCWFGGKPLPKKAEKCILSWKKYLPDYEIVEWNESNFDINYNLYTKEAYENKKYAFLTDVARLIVIYNEGGIYFDVDVETIKSFDDILECKAFFGIERENYVATGLGFGAEKNNDFIKALLDDYNDRHFVKSDGTLDITPCPVINSEIFKKYGFELNNSVEEKDGIRVYPSEYFNPLENATGKLNKTKNTYSIHWYNKSWVPKKLVVRSKITKVFHRIFGVNCFWWLKNIIKKVKHG